MTVNITRFNQRDPIHRRIYLDTLEEEIKYLNSQGIYNNAAIDANSMKALSIGMIRRYHLGESDIYIVSDDSTKFAVAIFLQDKVNEDSGWGSRVISSLPVLSLMIDVQLTTLTALFRKIKQLYPRYNGVLCITKSSIFNSISRAYPDRVNTIKSKLGVVAYVVDITTL